jgi:phytoene dehydrogenase-like protein
MLDAVVVGSGPNGLAAAVELARRGRTVTVFEGATTIGGGTRTEELIEPGHWHDVCSAVHPLGAASPYFRQLPLERFGLEWVVPELQLSHPLDGGRAIALSQSLEDTAAMLGADGDRYRRTVVPLLTQWDEVLAGTLSPLQSAWRRPATMARFGASLIHSAQSIASRFELGSTRALVAGLAAHSVARLSAAATGGVALILANAAHADGWPMARGGSHAIAATLAAYLQELGGTIETGRWVESVDELPPARAIYLDTAPGAAARIAGSRVASRMARQLTSWRHGPGVHKMDWILDGPIPWADPLSGRAGTVHVGGTFEEIAAAADRALAGKAPENPFVILAQPSLFDETRAPAGRHVVWAYCHVPAGYDGDATTVIEAQVERFAPGFRDHVVGRRTQPANTLAAYNPNNIGGDIGGGAMSLRRLLTGPRIGRNPYELGDGIYLCSAAAPPGGGVHGMSGYNAVRYSIGDRQGGR